MDYYSARTTGVNVQEVCRCFGYSLFTRPPLANRMFYKQSLKNFNILLYLQELVVNRLSVFVTFCIVSGKWKN